MVLEDARARCGAPTFHVARGDMIGALGEHRARWWRAGSHTHVDSMWGFPPMMRRTGAQWFI